MAEMVVARVREGVEFARGAQFAAMIGTVRVISVTASDVGAAVAEIERELSKPGRTGIRDSWIEKGRVVEVVKVW